MTTARILGVVAAVLGLGAAFMGSAAPAPRGGAIDVAALAREIDREADHVTAVELAQWIRDRKPGLRVIDVRSTEEFAAYHVPTAERVPLDSVVKLAFEPSETVVLYSEGGAHAAQAWVLLRALGHEHVFFLRGGLYDWLQDVMNPTIAENASPAARAEFERTSALSRYFGGQPRVVAANDASVGGAVPLPAASTPSSAARPATTATLVRAIRRRGC